MSKPASRSQYIDYCKRQLGAPVLEINVADEQIEDIVDDALQEHQIVGKRLSVAHHSRFGLETLEPNDPSRHLEWPEMSHRPWARPN